jgi:hypothetical protein
MRSVNHPHSFLDFLLDSFFRDLYGSSSIGSLIIMGLLVSIEKSILFKCKRFCYNYPTFFILKRAQNSA